MKNLPLNLKLSGSRILLRPPRAEDVKPLRQAVQESLHELQPWMTWCHAGYADEEVLTWMNQGHINWDDGTAYDFVVVERTTGTLLGSCGLNHLQTDYGMANLGYWIHSSHTGKGLATEAVRLLAQFGFEQLELNRIEIIMAYTNAASARVAEKAGAHLEGKVRNRLILRDEPTDALLYSLIPGDLNKI